MELPLLEAAEDGDLEKLQFLISNGEDINSADDEGYTALMYACNQGHYPIVECLIEQGADLNLTDAAGWAALDFATLSLEEGRKIPNQDIIDLMVQHGAVMGASADYPV